jgi:hypothetical protein
MRLSLLFGSPIRTTKVCLWLARLGRNTTHNHIVCEQFYFLSLANRRKIIMLLFLYKRIHYRIDCGELLQRLCTINNRNVMPLYAAMPRLN